MPMNLSSPLLKKNAPYIARSRPIVNNKAVEQQLEANVLDNVNVNFMFNKGAQLTNGLIDRERLYKVMMKVKSLAGTN